MTTQEILQQCIVSNNIIHLPDVVLQRDEYLEVKKSLELIGGKWKGGKTKGFVFEENPSELLQQLASGEQRNLKKEYQFFPTPPAVAAMMMEYLPDIQPGYKVLEPSAGDGALIKAFTEAIPGRYIIVDCFELMELNRMKLAKVPIINLIGDDFLQCTIQDRYDIIIANPPFTKNQDIDHIGKMFEACKPGGMIITLASPSWKFGSQKKQVLFREWLDSMVTTQEEIPQGMFKDSGTMVSAILLRIAKPLHSSPIPWKVNEKINKLEQMRAEDPENDFSNKLIDRGVDAAEQLANERKCRVCGCTDNDCSQCVKKTGKPCHWVESDLCSACEVREPEEIMKDIKQSMKEADKAFNELEQMISPKNTDMNFFEQLSNAGDVDLTLRIMKKNDKLTLNVMPGSGQSDTKPIIITGTPQDLDAEFFNSLYPQVTEVAGIIHNIEAVKKEAAEKKDEAEKKTDKKQDSKKNDNAVKKEKPVKKDTKTKEKKPAPERVSLFEGGEAETENQSENNDDESEETAADND